MDNVVGFLCQEPVFRRDQKSWRLYLGYIYGKFENQLRRIWKAECEMSLFDVLIFDDNPNSTMIIEKESSEIINNFSKSINQAIQVRSLKFLDEYYEYLLGAIYNNIENVQALENGTHILHETYLE